MWRCLLVYRNIVNAYMIVNKAVCSLPVSNYLFFFTQRMFIRFIPVVICSRITIFTSNWSKPSVAACCVGSRIFVNVSSLSIWTRLSCTRFRHPFRLFPRNATHPRSYRPWKLQTQWATAQLLELIPSV